MYQNFRICALYLLRIALIAFIALWASYAPAQAAPKQAQAAADTFRANGWWWGGASQSGTGFFFEAQQDTGFVAFFMYDDSGKAIWYAASGSFTSLGGDSFRFAGTLQSYRGGQPASSNVPSTPIATNVGAVTISFTGNDATVQLPVRSFNATRFAFADLTRPALSGQPEVGWYWNSSQGGRGYALEVQNNTVFMTMFHYNADGSPTWNTVTANVSATGVYSGDFQAFTGGQTLNGAYRAPNAPTSNGTLTANFSSSCNGSLQFPGNPTTSSVNRFGFAVTDSAACRTSSGSSGFLTAAQINARCPTAAFGINPDWTSCMVGKLELKERVTGASCIYEVTSDGTVSVTTGSRSVSLSRPAYQPGATSADARYFKNVLDDRYNLAGYVTGSTGSRVLTIYLGVNYKWSQPTGKTEVTTPDFLCDGTI